MPRMFQVTVIEGRIFSSKVLIRKADAWDAIGEQSVWEMPYVHTSSLCWAVFRGPQCLGKAVLVFLEDLHHDGRQIIQSNLT